jgi:hypothetical protein
VRLDAGLSIAAGSWIVGSAWVLCWQYACAGMLQQGGAVSQVVSVVCNTRKRQRLEQGD